MSAAAYLDAVAVVLRHHGDLEALAHGVEKMARVLRRSPKLDRRLYRLAFGGRP